MNIRRTVITGAAALALVAGGTAAGAVAFASSGTVYKGCVTGTSRTMEHVYTKASPPACPSGSFAATWNQVGQQGPQGPAGPQGPQGPAGLQGPQGPSGVVSMAQFNPSNATAVTGGFAFLGSPPAETFADTNTAAEVTATIDIISNNASFADADLGICYQKTGGGGVTAVSDVLASTASESAQTVSGIVGNLASGTYLVGMCEAGASSNLANGSGVGTMILAETASGVSLHHGASPAQPRPGRHG